MKALSKKVAEAKSVLTSSKRLDELADSKNIWIRLAVARNYHTSVETLNKLAKTKNIFIEIAIKENIKMDQKCKS